MQQRISRRQDNEKTEANLRWLVTEGYVTEFIDGRLFAPPPMVEAVSQYIREQGIAPANFYYEKFAASAA